MNFSAISNKCILGKFLRFPLRFIPANLVLLILQGKLKGKKWIVGSGNNGYWLGSYEYEKRILFEKTILEGDIVFDIGAHVGFYTILSSELVGINGKVIAFEPFPRNIFILKRHLQLNRCANVKVIEAAVIEHCGAVFFEEGISSSMGHTSPKGKFSVRGVSLDKLISNGEVPPPDCIKIDVEGDEMLVLIGAKSTLKNKHPKIFLATHGREVHKECCKFLKSLNYNLQSINKKNLDITDEILAR
jgi:FkbM family methyltransferase